MEISAKVLREVEFSGSLRGYNTDEVDEFLEQVAVALDRLQSESRLNAERAASERAGRDRTGIEDEESIRRTLVLAQRTADLAIKEAQEEAALLMDRTRAEAETVINEAHETAQKLATDTVEQLREEVDQLTELRDGLLSETDRLITLLDAERARITDSLSSALRFVERTLTPPAAIVALETPATAVAEAESEDSQPDVEAGAAEDVLPEADDEPSKSPDDLPESGSSAAGDDSSSSSETAAPADYGSGFDDPPAKETGDVGAPVQRGTVGDWARADPDLSGGAAHQGSYEFDEVAPPAPSASPDSAAMAAPPAMPPADDPKESGRRRSFRRKSEW